MKRNGFSMLEVAIAIAVIAILAGAAAPLVMKALNQQREQKTRDQVKVAYESIAGARDRRAPNMKADFGFNPPVAPTQLADLRFMTTINPAAAYRNGPVPPAYGAVAGGFRWGWNGPYWTGSIRPQAGTNGIPLDGWGRTLRWANNRVESAGADGVFGNADDLVYPNPALAVGSVTMSITLNRVGASLPAVNLQATVIDRNANAAPRNQLSAVYAFASSGSQSVVPPINANPGPITVQVNSVPFNAAYAQAQTLDPVPGENRTLTFTYNN